MVVLAVLVVVAMLGSAVAALVIVVTAARSGDPTAGPSGRQPSVLPGPYATDEPPVANQDHWHSAYGVAICGDRFEPPFTSEDDPAGIHSHSDGVIHVHPFFPEAAGANATLGVFLGAMGASLTDDRLTLDDGRTFTEGDDTCDGEPAVLQVARWPDATLAGSTDPEVFTEGLSGLRFENDLEAYTIAFAPEGADLPPPSSIPQLSLLSDVPPPAVPA